MAAAASAVDVLRSRPYASRVADASRRFLFDGPIACYSYCMFASRRTLPFEAENAGVTILDTTVQNI
ncbi:MAG: hypothetical protein C0511_09780 [Hyphomicrobium sp.]|nr:hypothetical protein [Hyphomicrobium sp.]